MGERARGSKFSLLRGANGGEKGRDAAGDVPFSVSPPPKGGGERKPNGGRKCRKGKGEIPTGTGRPTSFSGGEMEGGSLVSANDVQGSCD